jgi:hypothetical protein
MNTQKATVTKVEITQSESNLLDKQRPDFPSLEIADVAIGCLADSLRKTGRFCVKTWFKITFSDGEVYDGRIDVTPTERSIQRHVTDYVAYCAGRKRPPTMRAEDVPGYMKAMGIDPEQWAKFADSREFN